MRLEYVEDPDAEASPRVVLLHELTPESVEDLRGAISALAVGPEDHEVRIEALPQVQSVQECSLTAALGVVDRGVERVGESSFRCVLTRAGWERVVALLGPFAEPRENAFQYLTEAGEVEWIVSTSGGW